MGTSIRFLKSDATVIIEKNVHGQIIKIHIPNLRVKP
jgi:hypothetical protein